jgi:hypothetical protein
MPSAGMLHRVTFVRTDVSEELIASFIRVTRIGELGTTLAVPSNRRTQRRNTKQRASVASYSKRSQFTDSCDPDDEGAKFLRNIGYYAITRLNIPDDAIQHNIYAE